MLAVSLIGNVVLLCGKCRKKELPKASDTVRVSITDTLRYTETLARDSIVLRYKTAYLAVSASCKDASTVHCDTTERDSVSVEMPIVQRTYRDSSYTAWISGYDARLDSIEVYRWQETVTIKEQRPAKHWHLGVTGGYGLGITGLQPYIGVGLTYSIISF